MNSPYPTPTPIRGPIRRAGQPNCGAFRRPLPATIRPMIPRPNPCPIQPTMRANAKVSFQCVYQVVWCTQYRAPVLDELVEQHLKRIVAEVVAEKQAYLIGMKVTADHVHLLVEVPPQVGVHRLIKAAKARSARVLRDEFPSLRSRLPSLWTNSYLLNTVGNLMPPAAVQGYIEQQQTR